MGKLQMCGCADVQMCRCLSRWISGWLASAFLFWGQSDHFPAIRKMVINFYITFLTSVSDWNLLKWHACQRCDHAFYTKTRRANQWNGCLGRHRTRTDFYTNINNELNSILRAQDWACGYKLWLVGLVYKWSFIIRPTYYCIVKSHIVIFLFTYTNVFQWSILITFKFINRIVH